MTKVAPTTLDAVRASGSVPVRNTLVAWRLLDLDAIPSLDIGPLSEAERSRADRFRSPTDQRRFLARRWLLRSLLGIVLDRFPEDLEFEVGPHGKPRLGGGSAGRLEFNTSHRDRWMLAGWVEEIGFATEIGVDLEYRCHLPDGPALAHRWLHPEELMRTMTLGLDLHGDGFLRLWSRKEAVMKAAGLGVSLHPTSFSVPIEPILREGIRARVPTLPESRFELVDILTPTWPSELLGTICVREQT